MESPDNVVYSGSGDIYIYEDGPGQNRVMGITPSGVYYELAAVRNETDEVAGGCFSPDGKTMFFNMQQSGLTVAVSGPFRCGCDSTGLSMANAIPPKHLEPVVPSNYLLAALDRGYSKLEAAALHRLGVPLA